MPVGQIRQRQPKCAVAVCRVAEFPSDSGDIEDLIRRPVDEIIASDKSAQRVLWWTPVTNVSRLADWQLRESNEMGMKANARQQLIGRRWRRHGNCVEWPAMASIEHAPSAILSAFRQLSAAATHGAALLAFATAVWCVTV